MSSVTLGSEQRSQSLPDELERLHLSGRATDAQFAQNPLPVARAMGRALATLHCSNPPDGLAGRTDTEADAALEAVRRGDLPPAPFDRVKPETLTAMLDNRPDMSKAVLTHGAPIVSAVVLVDSVATFEPAGTEGLDPAERDLAIVIRSIAETFTSEVAATFIEGYEEAGGTLPHGPTLDWYGVVAAFR
jgi:aminoglycoside phosphotransferase